MTECPDTNDPTRFLILGSVEVSGLPGGRIDDLQRKTRQLLALLLAAYGQSIPTDRIIDRIWGDRPPISAPQLVRGHVMKLRKMIGAAGQELVEIRVNGYRIRPDSCVVDARIFEGLLAEARTLMAGDGKKLAVQKLQEALSLWRGPLALEGVRDIHELEAEAVRLEELRSRAEEMLMDAYLATGRAADAIPHLRMLTVKYPLRDRFWAQLMTALAAAHRPADAADTFLFVRRHFQEKAGMDPSPLLADVHQAILEGRKTSEVLSLIGIDRRGTAA